MLRKYWTKLKLFDNLIFNAEAHFRRFQSLYERVRTMYFHHFSYTSVYFANIPQLLSLIKFTLRYTWHFHDNNYFCLQKQSPIMHTKLWRGTIDLVAKIELHCHLLYYFIVYQVRMIEGWRVQRKNRLNTEITRPKMNGVV